MALAELSVTLAVILLIGGVAVALLSAPQRAVVVQAQVAELHQRARAGFSRLRRDIGGAAVAARDPSTSALRRRASIIPTRTGRQREGPSDAADLFDPAAITVLTAGDQQYETTGSVLSRSTPWVMLGPGGACSDAGRGGNGRSTPCGFRRDTVILVSDRTGRTDLLQVDRVDAGRVWFRMPIAASGMPSFGTGASLVPAVVHSYHLDMSRAQLRYRRDWGAEVPVLDNVVGVRFRYFGVSDVSWSAAQDPDGEARCVLRETPDALGSEARTVELARETLSDGPWCGGHSSFDADLLRLRSVRVELRLDASRPGLRGARPNVFARPGYATDPHRWLSDLTARFELSLRIPWRP